MLSNYRYFAFVLLLLLQIEAKTLAWQAPATSVFEPAPAAIHLVGHEDVALLERVQEVIDDWDPRRLVNPYVMSVPAMIVTQDSDGNRVEKTILRKVLRRPDLAEFIADVDAAEQLGKAFFWEMQAGSDFKRTEDGKWIGTACASCHYNAGADGRRRNSQRIPYVAWEKYKLHEDHKELEFGELQLAFDPVRNATAELSFPNPVPFSMIAGSQGVVRYRFDKLAEPPAPDAVGAWESEQHLPQDATPFVTQEWQMFYEEHSPEKTPFRQITNRNSPSVFNAGFSDRLFHDGRAESTFNGISIFGDFDHREVLYRSDAAGHPELTQVAILQAALASQAVGPIVNEVEMSYEGRTFHHLARKLLSKPILQYQTISDNDPVLANYQHMEDRPTYEKLIQQAFRREWWDCAEQVDLRMAQPNKDEPLPKGSMMEANFSLYWGLALLIYQSELVSKDSPFDAMMMGNPQPVNELWQREGKALSPVHLDRAKTKSPPPNGTEPPLHANGASVFQHGFRVFMNRGCIECHSGPLFSEVYERLPEIEHRHPIASEIHNALLPVVNADGLAYQDRTFSEQTLAQISAIVATAPNWAGQSDQVARKMSLLRHDARGNPQVLATLLKRHFKKLHLKDSDYETIAQLLKTYESQRVAHLGDRRFFSEDDRVALSEPISEPLLVEKMPIPPLFVPTRPQLPYQGPYAIDPYAFYDLGYYNLGVSPPRYDRGVGGSDYGLKEIDRLCEALNLIVTSVAPPPDSHIDPVQPSPNDPLFSAVNQLLESSSPLKSDMQGLTRALRTIEEESGLSQEQKETLIDAGKKVAEALRDARQSSSGASGSAYRLQPQIPTRGVANPPALREFEANNANVDEEPALCPEKTVATIDQSWDRGGLMDQMGNDTRRRSDHHFFSRARALVVDEEPWGLRKPFTHDNELAFWGAFKTPSLRNVDLTGPYMHNGRLETLLEVIDFYDVGGHVPRHLVYNPDKHPEIDPSFGLELTADDIFALWFFLKCLTDDSVRNSTGLFSHPSLNIVDGYTTAIPTVENVVELTSSP